MSTSIRRLATLGVALALLTWGCTNSPDKGSSSSPGTATSAAAGQSPTTGGGATAATAAPSADSSVGATTAPIEVSPEDLTGVTDTSIKLAVLGPDYLELAGAGLTPKVDVGEIAQKIADAWNAKGGINGRTVEIVYRTYSAMSDPVPQLQRICLDVAEGEKVFAAVTTSFYGDGLTCLAGDHDTPIVTSEATSETLLSTAHDNVFMSRFTWEGAFRALVEVLAASGELDSMSKFAVFGQAETGMAEAVNSAVVPALTAAGKTAPQQALIPFVSPIDTNAIAGAVSRLKADGVDGVFMFGNLQVNASFIAEAKVQDYHPRYLLSDALAGTTDILGMFAPTDQLTNVIGVSAGSRKGDPTPTAAAKQCVDTYQPGAGPEEAVLVSNVCELFDLAQRALEASGKDLSRPAFVRALGDLGSFEMYSGGAGSLRPGKFAVADQARLVRFDAAGCACWVNNGDWVDVDR